jgi:hypothetical protein
MIKPQIVSARELMALNTTELKRIGNWIYQPESLTLYNQEAGYEVDLEKINKQKPWTGFSRLPEKKVRSGISLDLSRH